MEAWAVLGLVADSLVVDLAVVAMIIAAAALADLEAVAAALMVVALAAVGKLASSQDMSLYAHHISLNRLALH